MKGMVSTKAFTALAGAIVLAFAIGCSGGEEASTTTTTTGGSDDGGTQMVTAAQVMDVLNARCVTCHKGAEAPEELQLDTVEGVLKGGEHGAVVNPGDAENSLIIKVMRGAEGVPKMPPQGESVPEEDIKLVEEWINSGANAS